MCCLRATDTESNVAMLRLSVIFRTFLLFFDRCQLTSPITTDMTAFLALDKANVIVKDLDISPMLTNIIGFVCWTFSAFSRATRTSHRLREEKKAQHHWNANCTQTNSAVILFDSKPEMHADTRCKKRAFAHPHCTTIRHCRSGSGCNQFW